MSVGHIDGSRVNFLWKIKDYDYHCIKKGGFFESPKFDVFKSEYFLRMYPGRDTIDFKCCLVPTSSENKELLNVELDAEMFFFSIEGQLIWSKKLLPRKRKCVDQNKDFYFCDKDYKQWYARDTSLSRSTLIIECKIFIASKDPESVTQETCATTRFLVKRRTYEWLLDDFRAIIRNQERPSKIFFLEDELILKMKIDWIKGVIGFDLLDISEKNTKSVYLQCQVSVESGEHKLNIREFQEATIEPHDLDKVIISSSPFIHVEYILKFEHEYLKNEALPLLIEFGYSEGETTCYSYETRCYKKEECQDFLKTNFVATANSLTSDIVKCYAEDNVKKFGDITIRHTNEVFSAHKAILCARSEFFKTMFEINMEENNTGVVDIYHGTKEIFRKVIYFIYTDCFKIAPNLEDSISLYEAAQFFRIPLLKTKCTSLLKSHLRVNNLCSLLVIADRFGDTTFKEYLTQFAVIYHEDVFHCEEWKSLLKENSELAEDIVKEVNSK